MKFRQSAGIGVLLFSMATGAHAVVEAGRVQFVFGVAHAIGGEGGQRQLAKAQPVYAGETIVTGPTASLQLRMIDKAVLAIRPNSQVHIETYHLADSNGQAILRLVQGSLRSVTGLIGQLHSDNYRIITNRAYLGVRGTDHEPSHILPGAAGAAEPGTYDKVNTGATFLAGPGGRIDLDQCDEAVVEELLIPRAQTPASRRIPLQGGAQARVEDECIGFVLAAAHDADATFHGNIGFLGHGTSLLERLRD